MDGRRLIEALFRSYVATLLLPILAGTGWVAVRSASLGGTLAAGVSIAAATTLAATTVSDRLDRLASLPAALALILPPLAYLPVLIVGDADAEPTGMVVVLLAVTPGIGIAVVLAATGVRNRRRRARATEHLVVSTSDENDESGISHFNKVAAGVGIGASLIVFGASVAGVDGCDGNTVLFSSLTGFSSLLLLFDNDGHELAVTDVGLRVGRSLTPWAALGGFRVTDETITVERKEWYRSARSVDRTEINDGDEAFIEALTTFLPRTDTGVTQTVATRENG